jgi:hypothetical protein
MGQFIFLPDRDDYRNMTLIKKNRINPDSFLQKDLNKHNFSRYKNRIYIFVIGCLRDQRRCK